ESTASAPWPIASLRSGMPKSVRVSQQPCRALRTRRKFSSTLAWKRSNDAACRTGPPASVASSSRSSNVRSNMSVRPAQTREPLLLVELALQGQREIGAHVFKVRDNRHPDAIPARLALDVLHGDLRPAQRPAGAHIGGRVLLVGDVLPDPVV